MRLFRKNVVAWCLYDWANSAFACSVMAAFFPIFFRQYWNGESVASTTITARLGVASAVASVIVVVLAPVLGAIADRTSAKKKFLFFFALIGVAMTAALFFIAQGNWLSAAAIYVAASVGFMASNSFYDALLPSVADESEFDVVSGLGYGAGYLGGGLLLVGHMLLLKDPAAFGFDNLGVAVRAAFVSVALWWALFSIPIFLLVQEKESAAKSDSGIVRQGFLELFRTFRELRNLKNTALFLLAYWFYIDGVDTVIRMAVDFGSTIDGIKSADLLQALLVTQLVGFPAAIVFGWLGKKVGTKIGLYVGIGAYICICSYGYFVDDIGDFYIVAVSIGLVQGGVQSLSRSAFARLVPAHKSGEFFGFYNMLGKFAAVLGPLLMGAVAFITESQRLSIVSLVLLFAVGIVLLRQVDFNKGAEDAAAYDRQPDS